MMTSATEVLRHMLDERGVDYYYPHNYGGMVKWSDGVLTYHAANAFPCNDPTSTRLVMHVTYPTPEQAIAATLGVAGTEEGSTAGSTVGSKVRGKLTAEQVREAIERNIKFYEGGDYDEQTIADELNATLGAGTCKVESMHGYTDARTHISWCVELSCHTLDAWEDSIPPSYCPICGARVVE